MKGYATASSSSGGVSTEDDNFAAQIISYRDKNGKVRIPLDSRTRKLRKWISLQRKKYSEGLLTTKQTRKLEKLGFQFKKLSGSKRDTTPQRKSSRTKREKTKNQCEKPFPVRIKELKALNRRKGNVKEHPSLHQWITEQEKRYQEGSLSSAEESKLKNAGLDLRIRKQPLKKSQPLHNAAKDQADYTEKSRDQRVSFKDRVSQLKLYYETHGHFNVHWKNDDTQLYRWLMKVKLQFKRGTLSPDEKKLLRAIGFSNKTLKNNTNALKNQEMVGEEETKERIEDEISEDNISKDFVDSLKKLVRVRDLGKKSTLSESSKLKLFDWAQTQRERYFEGKLSKAEKKKLREAGFQFSFQDSESSDSKKVSKKHYDTNDADESMEEFNNEKQMRRYKSDILSKKESDEIRKEETTLKDKQGNGREIVCYESPKEKSLAIVTHEKEVEQNSNNFLMRLNRLYEMTGLSPNPEDGLLKRLQYLEEVFFGAKSQVQGIFIDRLRLLEEELLSPPG